MKKLSILCAVAALAVGVVANAANVASTGEATGILNDAYDGSCGGTVFFNADGTYENAYAWQYGGVSAPDYGAFAEGYATPGQRACSVILDLTQTGAPFDLTADLYVWADAGNVPGAVIGATVGFAPGDIAFWPSLSRHAGAIDADCVDVAWVGFWGNWPDGLAGWFVGADLDGFGGLPRTNIGPGIGYPTGWNDVSIVWGPTQALGIGGEFVHCGTPTLDATWGQIKRLYN